MNQILCSTGALLGRPNGRDYRLLADFAKKLSCDGFEFMVYGSWYPELDRLISTVKELHLNIPVVHCQKSLGEALCGMTVEWSENRFKEYVMTEEEDRACFEKGRSEFEKNLRIANEFGADRMVLHLWNGIPSDRRIEKNVERFGVLREMARRAGVTLLVENVVCNCHDPLSDWARLYKSYPDAELIYDTKMAEFHEQNKTAFLPEWEWIWKEGHVKHLHVNDYGGGYMDWANLDVLPIGAGHVDFETFFQKLFSYGYDGDYTVEATGFDKTTGTVDCDMLNRCFERLRGLTAKYRK